MISLLLAATFALVEGGSPVAAFDVSDTNAVADVKLFNSRLREVTGTSIPLNVVAANTIRVTLEHPADISRRFEWTIRFPADRKSVV